MPSLSTDRSLDPQVESPRMPTWLRRFVRPRGREPLPVELTRQRIYVLPTPYGLFFALLLCVMALGALNFNNNPALILCFLLLSVMLSCLLRGYLSLSGLKLERIDASPAHVGEAQRLHLRFSSTRKRRRDGLVLTHEAQRRVFALDQEAVDVELARSAQQRGRQPLGRLKLHTQLPLGLFEVWTWLHPDVAPVVYPALEKDPPPPVGSGGAEKPQPRSGRGEDIHALREYRHGDSLRQIAWKHSARAGHLLVREYELPSGRRHHFSWHELAPLSSDARARRLARWLADAERRGEASVLEMPDRSIGPGRGNAHLHACFRALALAP